MDGRAPNRQIVPNMHLFGGGRPREQGPGTHTRSVLSWVKATVRLLHRISRRGSVQAPQNRGINSTVGTVGAKYNQFFCITVKPLYRYVRRGGGALNQITMSTACVQ